MTEGTLPIGLLDFLTFSRHHTTADLRNGAVESTILADQLGFRRVWIAEHHARGVPSTNPLVLLPLLGSLTQRVRLGPAVSLLRLRDPYLLAEDLATAAHFCSGRLDVGVGRGDVKGPGTDVLDPIRKNDEQLDQATQTLFALLENGNSFLDPPVGPVQQWTHGAGHASGRIAAELGFNYCHGLFFNPDPERCRQTLAEHAATHPQGTRAVAVAVICNEDRRRAETDGQGIGLTVARAGGLDQITDLIEGLLADELIDEVVVTEQSARIGDHHDALRALADAVRTRSAAAP